jgi:hypothetical protein
MQPVQFRLRHRALQPKQEAIIRVAWIIDALLVNDQGVGEGTDLQQAIPITARAGQARDFQAQHRSHVAQSHFGHQPLKSIAPNTRGARLALILVNDANTSLVPPQLMCPLDQIILPGRTAGIVPDLRASSIGAHR